MMVLSYDLIRGGAIDYTDEVLKPYIRFDYQISQK